MKGSQKFTIPYYISNNGDGSASLRVCKSLKEAKEKDEASQESGDCFAESTVGELEVFIKDGDLFIEQGVFENAKYTRVWVKIDQK